MIPKSGGVTVTHIEANHCKVWSASLTSYTLLCYFFKGTGSALFLFEGPQTVNAGDSIYKSSHVGSTRTFRYLHCGDFRAFPNIHSTRPSKANESTLFSWIQLILILE